jgi:hypothetical protein
VFIFYIYYGTTIARNGSLPSVKIVLFVIRIRHNLLRISNLIENNYDFVLNLKTCQYLFNLMTLLFSSD